jgi:hypothetical protein
MKHIADCIINEDYKSVRNSYNSTASSSGSSAPEYKRWIIDIDDTNDILTVEKILAENSVACSQVLGTIKTPNGVHIITKPFNLQSVVLPKHINIHKNNPTVLWSL